MNHLSLDETRRFVHEVMDFAFDQLAMGHDLSEARCPSHWSEHPCGRQVPQILERSIDIFYEMLQPVGDRSMEELEDELCRQVLAHCSGDASHAIQTESIPRPLFLRSGREFANCTHVDVDAQRL